ncbi:ATP-binding protein [Bulleidia sp. zg-1006]|uniref:ATP-binding protein n=1 Tax=Bulleidia sp. zg-1006 TaxID=2806552 RepID=UPI0019394815|nr:ATP-binding protein [Bulleidia sp. zg-1006]QRG87164.1 ATP-binding protein [Bulleidia sp. zg-1006]
MNYDFLALEKDKKSQENYEKEAKKLANSLKQDCVLIQYLQSKQIPLSCIDQYPFRLARWRKNYEPCVHCSGLQACGQKKCGFYEGIQVNEYFETILEACTYKRKEREEKSHLSYYTYSELAPEFQKASFHAIDMEKEAKTYLQVVSQVMRASYENEGLFIEGSLGSGKTYLAACACNSHAQKKEYVSFVHMPSFMQKMMSLMKDGEFNLYLDRVKKVKFLVLDDIGAEAINAWGRDTILLPILMYRYDHHLCTWFTSNLDFEELEKKYSQTFALEDKMAGARIVERMKALAQSILLSGKDRRIKG